MRALMQKQKPSMAQASSDITKSDKKASAESPDIQNTWYWQLAIGNQAARRLSQANPNDSEARSSTKAATARWATRPDAVSAALADGVSESRFPAQLGEAVKGRRSIPLSSLQAKLTVGKSDDPLEQEADRMAAQVMRVSEPQLQRTCACGGGCSGCQNEQAAHDRLQTERIQTNDSGEIAVPPIVHEVLGSSGQALDPSTRNFMEVRFGHDFSRVRVHTEARAVESANAVGAQAYTVGQHIAFDSGQYRPQLMEGRQLLAHELTHVAQQSDAQQRAGVVQRQPSGSGPAPSPSPASATIFQPGVNHGHTPSGRWADVQANPNSGFWVNRACANFSPNVVVLIAINREFSDKPLALDHLNWYLGNGQGADYIEDTNLDRLLRTDTGVQALLAGIIPSSAPASGRFTHNVKVEQSNYQNQDFRYAFGAIDRLDFEVDFTAGTVHAWFQDRYEWHPVYPGLYTALAGDVVRETNCVHAALVELQTGGARDFWMKGEATVPLSLFRRAPAPSGSGNDSL